MNIQRTNSKDPLFIELVKRLDAELAAVDGEDHAFYNQFNSIDDIPNVLVLEVNGQVVACGAIKAYDTESFEVKRMYVLPEHRQKGYASALLEALESWAVELDAKRCLLETGKRQVAATALYQQAGYSRTFNYGPYKDMANSQCFNKEL